MINYLYLKKKKWSQRLIIMYKYIYILYVHLFLTLHCLFGGREIFFKEFYFWAFVKIYFLHLKIFLMNVLTQA